MPPHWEPASGHVPEFGRVLFPALAGDGLGIELAFVADDKFLALITSDDTGISPGEIIHVPEGVERQGEGEDGCGDDVDDHPPDHFPFPSDDEDDGLETVDRAEKDECRNGDNRCV